MKHLYLIYLFHRYDIDLIWNFGIILLYCCCGNFQKTQTFFKVFSKKTTWWLEKLSG